MTFKALRISHPNKMVKMVLMVTNILCPFFYLSSDVVDEMEHMVFS